MPWSCEQTEDRLLDALEGGLGAAAKAEMDAHLAVCTDCAGLVASVRLTVGRLRRLEAVEPEPWLVTKILEATTAPKPATRRRFAWLGQVWQPRFALGVVAVLVTISIVMRTASGGSPASLAAMNPVQVYRQIDRRAHLVYAHGVKFFSDLRVVYEIQSRFQPQTESVPAPTPEKRSSEKLDRLLYGLIENPISPEPYPAEFPSPLARQGAGTVRRVRATFPFESWTSTSRKNRPGRPA